MTTITAGAPAQFSIGTVINRTFAVVQRNFVSFFLLTLIAISPLIAFNFYNASTGVAASNATTIAPALLPYVVVGGLVYMVLNFLLQAALTYGTVMDLSGRKVSLAACLQTGVSDILPLLGIAILVGAGVILGFILLIVPGIMLALRWITAVPVRVVEGPGLLKAMGRSAELTRGHRWAILGLIIIFAFAEIGLSLLMMPIGLIIAFSPGGAAAPLAVFSIAAVSSFISTITAMFGTVGIASLYFELRTVKEGVGAEELAKVFA